MKSRFVLTMIVMIVLITSCSQENTAPSNAASNQTFPNEVGNHWVYKYDDGYTNGKQYIFVDIVGTTTLPDGQSATIWTSTLQDTANNKYLIDSAYVVVDNQKAIFYTPPCLTCTTQTAEEKRRYVFPLQVCNRWFTDKLWGDTTKVLSLENLTVPAGTFENTYELSKTVGYIFETYTRDSIWLTPNIGMTKFYKNEFATAFGPGNGIWELADYNLK